MRNVGDTAMLQAALRRMIDRWPAERIDVFTDDPEGLARIAPGVTPVSARGRRAWLEDEGRRLGRIGQRLSAPTQNGLRASRPRMWFRAKQFMLRLRGDTT